MKKGFTLLETLIALSLLTISLLGIYKLTDNAIFILSHSDSKSLSLQKAYERFLIKTNFPDKILPEVITDSDGVCRFEEIKVPTILPQLTEVRLKATVNEDFAELIYYEVK